MNNNRSDKVTMKNLENVINKKTEDKSTQNNDKKKDNDNDRNPNYGADSDNDF